MLKPKSTLPHISQNKRANNKADYYKSDDPNIVMEVKTVITEVHLDILGEGLNQQRIRVNNWQPTYPVDSSYVKENDPEYTFQKEQLSALEAYKDQFSEE